MDLSNEVNWWFIKRTTMKESMETKKTTTKKKLYSQKAKDILISHGQWSDDSSPSEGNAETKKREKDSCEMEQTAYQTAK